MPRVPQPMVGGGARPGRKRPRPRPSNSRSLPRYAEAVAREALAKKALEDLAGAGLAGIKGEPRLLPLATGLAKFFPEGGLRRGSTIAIAPGLCPGATSLFLALLSGPSASGSWCAAVGLPDLGLVAAAGCGIDLSRMALVPSPGPNWAAIVAALLEGFDVVALQPPGSASAADARKLEARARERGAVLAVLSSWQGHPEMRLEVTRGSWRGLGEGFGYLAGRELEVVATGRGAASRPRRGRIWLGESPGPGGTTSAALPASICDPWCYEPASGPARLAWVPVNPANAE